MTIARESFCEVVRRIATPLFALSVEAGYYIADLYSDVLKLSESEYDEFTNGYFEKWEYNDDDLTKHLINPFKFNATLPELSAKAYSHIISWKYWRHNNIPKEAIEELEKQMKEEPETLLAVKTLLPFPNIALFDTFQSCVESLSKLLRTTNLADVIDIGIKIYDRDMYNIAIAINILTAMSKISKWSVNVLGSVIHGYLITQEYRFLNTQRYPTPTSLTNPAGPLSPWGQQSPQAWWLNQPMCHQYDPAYNPFGVSPTYNPFVQSFPSPDLQHAPKAEFHPLADIYKKDSDEDDDKEE